MLYGKVSVEQGDLNRLYREDVMLGEDGRMIFRRTRRFQEYLGAISASGDTRVISKGKKVRVQFNFPGYLPVRVPLDNWFQVALKREGDELIDLLGCNAKHKGLLPGTLMYREDDEPAEFVMEDEPRFTDVNYALFIYDEANYAEFMEKLELLLCSYLEKGKNVVMDGLGRHILASDDATEQTMLLVPLGLIIGGKEYVCNAWETALFR